MLLFVLLLSNYYDIILTSNAIHMYMCVCFVYIFFYDTYIISVLI